jgi:outer membrane lipoprotein carrier protein
MQRILLLTITVLAALSSPTFARQITPLAGLEALRRVFSGISDFSAEVTQEKQSSLMKRSLQTSGTVRFRKPDMFLLETSPPFASRMLLRDGTIEQQLGSGERNRTVLPPDQGLKQWLERFSMPLTAVPVGMAVQADLTGAVYSLTITPQGKGQVREVAISFHEDGTFRKLTISERNGDRTVMNFRKVRRNSGLTEKDFRLE